FSVAIFTFTYSTPSNFFITLSTAFAQAAHVIPPIFNSKFLGLFSFITLYPAFSIADFISSKLIFCLLYSILSFSVAIFTLELSTPSNFLVIFSTAFAQDTQLIPAIVYVSLLLAMIISFHYFYLCYIHPIGILKHLFYFCNRIFDFINKHIKLNIIIKSNY